MTSDSHDHLNCVTQGLLALVEAHQASWHVNSAGKLELRLVTGEIFQVERQMVIRTA
jgi:hypothetical protein